MAEIMLNDEDRKLIAHYREWSQADMAPTWLLVGVMSTMPLALVVFKLLDGRMADALGLTVLWAIVAYATIRFTQRKLRLSKLITKLAALAAPTPAGPLAGGSPVSTAEPDVAPERGGK